MSTPADDSRAEALERLDVVERELAQLEESVRGTAARLRGEVARARAAVHDLHGIALTPGAGGRRSSLRSAATIRRPSLTEPADDGARLVALDLVMRDVPRADAERELQASFPGSDAARLLDEAAASLGG